MNRLDFINLSASAAVATGLTGSTALFGEKQGMAYDKFGGWHYCGLFNQYGDPIRCCNPT